MKFNNRRKELALGLFSQITDKGATGSGHLRDGLKNKFQKLKKLKKPEMGRWWDGVTLQKYLDNQKIPSGLKILIFPTFDDLDEESLKEWEDNLQNASNVMMRILMKHADKKASKLQEEIDRLEREIETSDLKGVVIKNFNTLASCVFIHLSPTNDLHCN